MPIFTQPDRNINIIDGNLYKGNVYYGQKSPEEDLLPLFVRSLINYTFSNATEVAQRAEL